MSAIDDCDDMIWLPVVEDARELYDVGKELEAEVERRKLAALNDHVKVTKLSTESDKLRHDNQCLKAEVERLTQGNVLLRERDLGWLAKAEAKVYRLQTALVRIRKYGEGNETPNGICPHGCDCPDIAQQALESE